MFERKTFSSGVRRAFVSLPMFRTFGGLCDSSPVARRIEFDYSATCLT
jgi:hypothetical protein